MKIRIALLLCGVALVSVVAYLAARQPPAIQYLVLATNKTSTMQKEMQEAAAAGFRFGDVMGGDTAFGGSEVVVIMHRNGSPGRFDYRLLATSKTSTMQKELQEAGDAGFSTAAKPSSRPPSAAGKSSRYSSGQLKRQALRSMNTGWWRRTRPPPCRRSWRQPVTRDSSLSGSPLARRWSEVRR